MSNVGTHCTNSTAHCIAFNLNFLLQFASVGACLVFNSGKDTWHCHSLIQIHPHLILCYCYRSYLPLQLVSAGSWIDGGNGKITSNGPLPSTCMRPCNTASTNSAVTESAAVCIKTCSGKRSPPTSLVSTGMTCVHVSGKLTNTCTLSLCWVGMSEGKCGGR